MSVEAELVKAQTTIRNLRNNAAFHRLQSLLWTGLMDDALAFLDTIVPRLVDDDKKQAILLRDRLAKRR